jgi:hypothetical protein
MNEGTDRRRSRWQNRASICSGDAERPSPGGCHPGGGNLPSRMEGREAERRLMSKFSVCIHGHTKQPCKDDEASAETGARRSALHSRSSNRPHGANNRQRNGNQKYAHELRGRNRARFTASRAAQHCSKNKPWHKIGRGGGRHTTTDARRQQGSVKKCAAINK